MKYENHVIIDIWRKVKMKVSFGKFNLPHFGHKYLIDQCDIFVLSSGAKNASAESRIKILNKLGVDTNKIIVGNPFNEINKIVKNNPDVEIIYTEDNFSLVKKFQGKAKLTLLKKVGGISSTKIRQLFKENKTLEIFSILSKDTELYKLIEKQYESENFKPI